MRLIRRHLSYANVASTLALVFAMGGGAYAALSPVHNGVIHTCFRTSNGALRVVRAGARCGRRERALAFNQRGPVGPRGATGAPGRDRQDRRHGPDRPDRDAAGRSVSQRDAGRGQRDVPERRLELHRRRRAPRSPATASRRASRAWTLTARWPASRGVTGVEPGTGTGVYCLKLASTPSVGVASVRGDAATSGSAQVLIPAASAACAATGDTSAEVLTANTSGTARHCRSTCCSADQSAALPFTRRLR